MKPVSAMRRAMAHEHDLGSDGMETPPREPASLPLPPAVSGRRPPWQLGRFVPKTPLERRLFLIVFIGLLPLALLSFATLLYSAQSQKTQVLNATVDTVRAVITAVDAELEEAIAALDALAASPRLARGDLERFREEALQILRRRPGWENIALYDAEARPLMNTSAAPDAAPPPAADRMSVERAIASRTAQVGDLVRMVPFDTHAFAVRLPIERDGRVAHVLAAAITPPAIQSVLMRQTTPEGGVVAIFDRNYNVVARSAGYDEWLSRPAAPGMRALLEQGRVSGWGTTSTLEGIPVYSVYYRSPQSGWSAAVGIPTAALDGPILRSFTILGVSILLSALLGMFASALVARTITRPMRELASAAQAMGRGRRPPAVRTSLPEIRQAAQALSFAHTEREALLQRERQARLLEQEARQLAERANRAKDEFLAMLGHELRNPLAAISNAARLLDADGASPDAAQRARAIIQRQAKHLAQMTDDLLDTGRVVMGKIQMAREPLNLAAVVQHALDALRNSDRLSDHDVIAELEPVWIEGDAMRIEQIVVNLMTNAVKYSPAGSRICLGLQREGDEAVLRVRDFGLGLEPDLLPRVFDLFVQGRRTLDRSQGGLGIGLTLVRRLVELHDGRIAALSEGHGKGSEFVVRLPAIEAQAQAQPAPAEAIRADARTAPRKVVIVEDNADVRSSLKSLLELEGHWVHEAADGPAGVEAILRESPDVAIVDIGLPYLDGYGVARTVRASLPDVRLVALTGYGNKDAAQKDVGVEFDAYVVKPVDPQVLGRLLRESFGRTKKKPATPFGSPALE
jgi:signal transduction histidine kinase/ActR/RegA family two-component response regulator